MTWNQAGGTTVPVAKIHNDANLIYHTEGTCTFEELGSQKPQDKERSDVIIYHYLLLVELLYLFVQASDCLIVLSKCAFSFVQFLSLLLQLLINLHGLVLGLLHC